MRSKLILNHCDFAVLMLVVVAIIIVVNTMRQLLKEDYCMGKRKN